jgi:hypothetical protein
MKDFWLKKKQIIIRFDMPGPPDARAEKKKTVPRENPRL